MNTKTREWTLFLFTTWQKNRNWGQNSQFYGIIIFRNTEIMSYLLDICVPRCGEAKGRERRQDGRDLRTRLYKKIMTYPQDDCVPGCKEGEGRTEGTWKKTV